MPFIQITPNSKNTAISLPSIGDIEQVNSIANPLPLIAYTDETAFLEGCASQVSYVYNKLGGQVLNLEITQYNVYAAYQEACLKYSYLVNLYQGKNVLSSALGTPTGTFDSTGNLVAGGGVEPGSHLELKYPRMTMNAVRRWADMISAEGGIGGNVPVYRTYFDTEHGVQDYDLQSIIWAQSTDDPTKEFYGKIIENERIFIKRLYYKSPISQWRFYGFFGSGLSAMGNLSSYGQWSDDSSFQVVPVWQNRLQAMAYEESLFVRMAHSSYEIKNNKLRIYPVPSSITQSKMWLEFSVGIDPFSNGSDMDNGVDGVNGLSNIPFEILPYASINSIGKQWIRDYAFSCAKEVLGYVRSKISSIPFPGSPVTLNGDKLVGDAQREKQALEAELHKILTDTSYTSLLAEQEKGIDHVAGIQGRIPRPFYVG